MTGPQLARALLDVLAGAAFVALALALGAGVALVLEWR